MKLPACSGAPVAVQLPTFLPPASAVMPSPAELPFINASLEWDAQGWPRSTQYGDIYFSASDALGESTHVFLRGNRLAERWQELHASHFTIGELGFGSGLNFLNTCRLWCSQAPASATLHYVACELHPLTRADMQRLHEHWPELRSFSETLLGVYPDHTPGIHQATLQFGKHRIVLTLLYGDALAMLQGIEHNTGWRADAWYLDGFSPKLNPALWQGSLLALLARLGKPGTSAATYSVSGAFRRQLAEAGFNLEKLPGYAGKRHMLRAWLPENNQDTARPAISAPPRSAGTACIIGAGLAGCSTAFALAQSGWNVVILEREALASQGSGNPQGILHCKPGKTATPVNQFNLQAYLHAIRHYRNLAATQDLQWHGCGMLQLAVTAALRERFGQLIASGLYATQILRYVDTAEASAMAGVALDCSALHFPDSGWLSPPQLCERYVAHPNIRLVQQADVLALAQQAEGWRIDFSIGEERSELIAGKVILCNSLDAHRFAQTRHYPLISNRGQVDIHPAAPATGIKLVLCGQGYIVPAHQGKQSIGGSYFVADEGEAALLKRSELHVRQVGNFSSVLGAELEHQSPLIRRIGTRCITPDRMPLVGQVCEPGQRGKPLADLYINVGHGSHGLTRTPLCAALLASLLNGTPPPLPDALAALLRPVRFI